MRVPRLAHQLDEPLLVRRQRVGHLLGEPLNGAGREDVRRVAFDELSDVASPEGIAVDIQRRGAGAVLERRFVALEAALGVGARDPKRKVHAPLTGSVHIRARDAREALAVADVGASAIERVELRREELVAELERLVERLTILARRHEVPQLGLGHVLCGSIVHEIHLGELRDNRPYRRTAREARHRGGRDEGRPGTGDATDVSPASFCSLRPIRTHRRVRLAGARRPRFREEKKLPGRWVLAATLRIGVCAPVTRARRGMRKRDRDHRWSVGATCNTMAKPWRTVNHVSVCMGFARQPCNLHVGSCKIYRLTP